MAAGSIRLTKAERAYLEAALGSDPSKVAGRILEKLERSELVKGRGRAPGLGAQEAIRAFREVLGDRLVLPPPGAAGVYGQMANRLRDMGLTFDDCLTIARAAICWKARRIEAESLIRQAAKLLAEGPEGAPKASAPLEMEGF